MSDKCQIVPSGGEIFEQRRVQQQMADSYEMIEHKNMGQRDC